MNPRAAVAAILAACLVLIVLVYHVGVEAGRAQHRPCAAPLAAAPPPPYVA